MIHHVQGNLLTSDCNVIAHQSNCKMGFGSGIAGQIRHTFPAALKAFMEDDRTPEKKLGHYSYGFQKESSTHIFNLYGQLDYGKTGRLYTVYPALEKAVCAMLFTLDMSKKVNPEIKYKIGMPWKIGCDRAGGDWHNVVYPMLVQRFNENGRELWLYEYNP